MKLTHSFDREDVMAYVDGALSPERAAVVERHLAGCDECRRLADDLRGLSERLAAWQVEASPVRLASLVSRAPVTLARRGPDWFGRRVFGVPGWALVAVPASLVILVALPLMTMHRSPAPAAQVMASPIPANERADRQVLNLPVVGQQRAEMESSAQPARRGPMIVRTATIHLSTDAFDGMREQVERVVAAHAGRIGSIQISGEPTSGRRLDATLRIRSTGLDAALGAIRQLGKVTSESQASEEITDAYQNLTVRIANGKREEQRLVELLAKRTGDLADVLAVEQALARVRSEVEQMEASERMMIGRVDEATVTLRIAENRRADLGLGPASLGTRFQNAFVDGVRDAADGLIALALWVIEVGPTFLLWALVLAWPLKKVWASRNVSQ